MRKLLITLMLMPLMTLAETETVGGLKWTYTVRGNEVEVGAGSQFGPAISIATTGAIEIPSSLGGMPVTSIADYAFYLCTGLTSVSIPDGVTNIGREAFRYCLGLESVVIPSSVVSIRQSAFGDCIGLGNGMVVAGDCVLTVNGGCTPSVAVPQGVRLIADSAFYGCIGLKSVLIPSSVRFIGNGAFAACNGLAEIVVSEDNAFYCSLDGVLYNKGMSELLGCPAGKRDALIIPSGTTKIGDYAFDACRELTAVIMPIGMKYIGNYAFYQCNGLTTMSIPEGVVNIGDHAFDCCYGLTSVTIPDGVKSIGACAFYICGLTSVEIPASVTNIADSAFSCCYGLESLTISEGVTSIGESAFSYCSGLTEVAIPVTVTSIGNGAFNGCSGLRRVDIVDLAKWCAIEFGSNPLTYAKHLYLNGDEIRELVIPDGVTNIGKCAFSCCCGVTSVTLPDSVKIIGDSAFSGCDNLTSAFISPSVIRVGNRAFEGCGGLMKLVISDGVTSIGEYAFSDCSWLTAVVLPPSIENIGGFAFSGCSRIAMVVISEGVKSINGYYVFENCVALESVFIPSSMASIENSVFHGCTGLKSFCVDSANAKYSSRNGLLCSKDGKDVYMGVNGDVMIPSCVTDISVGAFSGCRGLKSVVMPLGVTSIGHGAFSGCTGLTSVAIPSSVKSVGSKAFDSCGELISVMVPSSVSSIGSHAFNSCGKLATVYVSKGDIRRVSGLYAWPSGVEFSEIVAPTIEGDSGAAVTENPTGVFVVRPSEENVTVDLSVPDGIDAEMVTVEVSSKVESVKLNGAKVKVVNGSADITEFLNVPAANGNGVIDLTKATVKEEIVKEAMDAEKGAKIVLDAANPSLTTPNTRVGLFYQLREGVSIEGMSNGDSTIGDGKPWTPEIKVKGGNSAFYSIGVGKGE